jgi:hypothetical protein
MTMDNSGKLTNLQIEILKLYNFKLPDEQLIEIKQLLANYFANKVTEKMEEVWENQNWTEETIDKLREEHLRTPYK